MKSYWLIFTTHAIRNLLKLQFYFFLIYLKVRLFYKLLLNWTTKHAICQKYFAHINLTAKECLQELLSDQACILEETRDDLHFMPR